jgi:hypothetical protein
MPAANSQSVTSALPQPLIDKIIALPLTRLAELEDFVDFIGQREAQQQSAREAQQHIELKLTYTHAEVSAPAFADVWNNAEDDVYDAL